MSDLMQSILFSPLSLNEVCEIVLSECMNLAGCQRGLMACKASRRDSDLVVISLIDPEPRHFDDTVQVQGEYTSEPHDRQVVLRLNFRGELRAAIVLVTDRSQDYIERKVRSIVPSPATQIVALQQAEADADMAHETFLATLSHEMRTPLNGAVGMSRLLATSPDLDDSLAKFAEVAYSCSLQAVSIVNDLMDFSRMDSGRIAIKSAPMDLARTIQECHDVVYIRATEKTIEPHYEIDETLPEIIVADAERIRQVLINLLVNAIKFSPECGTVMTRVVRGQAHSDGTVDIDFIVCDRGCGIPRLDRERVFEPYTRARIHSDADAMVRRPSTDARFQHREGMGLGLCICRKLAKLMGGVVEVHESHIHGPRKGTKMLFRLPVRLLSNQKNEDLTIKRLMQDSNVLVAIGDTMAHQRMVVCDCLLGYAAKPFTCTSLDSIQGYLRRDFAFEWAIVGPEMRGAWTQTLSSAGVTVLDLEKDIGLDVTCSKLAEILVDHHDGNKTRSWPRRTGTLRRRTMRKVYQRTHILVVEDDPSSREVMKASLERLGYDTGMVRTAEDGMMAFEMFKIQPSDIILMDLRMPLVDGFAATRLIMDHCAVHHMKLPVVVPCTAYVGDQDRRRCREVGMTRFLTKPISLDQLEILMAQLRCPNATL